MAVHSTLQYLLSLWWKKEPKMKKETLKSSVNNKVK